MFVVLVSPIIRSSFAAHLSFFSKEKPPVGTIVYAPIRGKVTPALVLAATPAREEKLALKGTSFPLKKITLRSTKRIFGEETVRAFEEIARYHAAPLGVVFASFTPAPVLNSLQRIVEPAREKKEEATSSDRLVLQAETEERMRMYRNIAREAFARGESVVLVTPSIAEAERAYEELNRGIEDRVVVLTSTLAKKAILSLWNKAASDPKPLLIICTSSFAFIPRSAVGTYIIERESAQQFVSRERPHLDVRLAVEYLARERRARLVLADFPLRIETRARLERGDYEELMRLQASAQGRTVVKMVDVRKKAPGDEAQEAPKKKKFSVFADITEREIRNILERKGRVFLYGKRKGFSPLTVCNDCETVVADPASGTPMTLHKTSAGNVFMSSYSGAVMPANISCASCGSWNLVSLGIGVERIIEEAEKLFPAAALFPLTADSATTHAQAKKIALNFFNAHGSILVGTDRALPYLAPLPLSVVVSIDSLLALSAWRAHTLALHTLFHIRDMTQGTLVIQTRSPDHPAMRAAVSGNPSEFIRHELAERERFGYPPFATFVGLAWTGSEKNVERLGTLVKETLGSGFDVVGPLPARQVDRNRYLMRAVVRLERGRWPEPRLLAALGSLPSDVSVSIDPDEIV